ncbi:MAG: 6-phosphogluconolactonase [Aureispira sp.]
MMNKEYPNRVDLEQDLVAAIVGIINKAIAETNRASILFSGGSTPKGLMNKLAKTNLDWEKVAVGLVDDRMVDPSSDFSNLKLIQTEFLSHIDGTTKPVVYPLVEHAEKSDENMAAVLPHVDALGTIDIALLGMGTDGHFASLFPKDAASSEALAEKITAPLLYTTAPAHPTHRISFSWHYLKAAKNLVLHITGDAKKQLLEANRSADDALPIDTFLQNAAASSSIYWAP